MELSVASTFTFPLNALEPSAHLKLPLPKDFLGNGLITNKREYVENVFHMMYCFFFTYYKLIGYLPNCQFCVDITDSVKHKNVPNSRDEPMLSIIPIKIVR